MPLTLLTGEEDYLLTRSLKQLREKVVPPEWQAFNYKLLEKPSPQTVMETIGTVSLGLTGQTLVEIQQFSWLSKAVKTDTAAEKAAFEQMQTAITQAVDTKHLLFVSSKIDRKLKFPKWLLSLPGVDHQSFDPIPFYKPEQAAQTLMQLCKAEGYNLQNQAATLLVERLGTSLQPLINEVQKLAVYAGNGPITVDAVNQLSQNPENAFAMLDAWLLAQTKTKQPHPLQQLQDILLKQHPVQLFALIQTFLDNLFSLKLYASQGMSADAIAQRTQKHPFKVKKDLETYHRVSLDRLKMLKKRALELEYQAKSGQVNDRLALEMLLCA